MKKQSVYPMGNRLSIHCKSHLAIQWKKQTGYLWEKKINFSNGKKVLRDLPLNRNVQQPLPHVACLRPVNQVPPVGSVVFPANVFGVMP